MAEHPILYSTQMIKAYMEDIKTMTRRVITKQNSVIGEGGNWAKLDFYNECVHIPMYRKNVAGGEQEKYTANAFVDDGFYQKGSRYMYLHVPYNFKEDATVYRVYPRWMPDDRLWVRETFDKSYDNVDGIKFYYRADFNNTLPIGAFDWKPSIHMPRVASRLTQTITEIRVERLQNIIDKDILREGINLNTELFPQVNRTDKLHDRFQRLWDSINAKRGYSWESNPWVWVISFPKYSEEPTRKQ